jgi:hypothetical protein
MKQERSPPVQITVQVSDRMRRQAELQGLPVVDFYAMLISRGLEATRDPTLPARSPVSALLSAVDRVRSFRSVDRIAED